MEENTQFFNLYIEKILNEVTELTKAKLILQTQIAWNDKKVQEMTEANSKLQADVDNLQAKLEGKKAAAKSAKAAAASDVVQEGGTF